MVKRGPGFLTFTGFVGLLIAIGAGGYFAWTQMQAGKEPAEAADEGVNASAPKKDALEAMQVVFPGADPVTGAITGADADAAMDGLDVAAAVSRPLLAAGSRDRPVLITVTEEKKEACHSCSGSLSVYYLKRTGSALVVEQAFPHFLGGNGFGAAGELHRIKLGGGKEAYSYETGFTGQGYTCGIVDVFTLEVDRPALILKAEPIFYDDSGAITDGSHITIDGKIARTPKAHELEIVFPAAKGREAETAGFDLEGDVLKTTAGKSLERTC